MMLTSSDQRSGFYRQEVIELVAVITKADDVEAYASPIYDVQEERHGNLPGTARASQARACATWDGLRPATIMVE